MGLAAQVGTAERCEIVAVVAAGRRAELTDPDGTRFVLVEENPGEAAWRG